MAQSVASTYGNFPSGRQRLTYTAQIARTDTSAKDLFTLNAGDIPLSLSVAGSTASNAGTNATLSIGSTSNTAFFLAAFDVKTANSGAGFAYPSSTANLNAPLPFNTTVQGTYAEAGAASSAGGPWTVVMDVLKV